MKDKDNKVNEFENLGIPGIVCTYYNEKDRTFHMKFADGTDNLSRVAPEDEMDITVGFMMCLVKKIARKNKVSVKGLSEKYFRDSKKKRNTEEVTEDTCESSEQEDSEAKEEIKTEAEEIVTEDTDIEKTTIEVSEENDVEEDIELSENDESLEEDEISEKDLDENIDTKSEETSNSDEEEASDEEYRLVDESLLSDDKIKEILENCYFMPIDENVQLIRQGYYNIYVNHDSTDYKLTAKEGNLLGYTISYMNDGNMARITVPTIEEAQKYVEWLKTQIGVDGEIKPLYE